MAHVRTADEAAQNWVRARLTIDVAGTGSTESRESGSGSGACGVHGEKHSGICRQVPGPPVMMTAFACCPGGAPAHEITTGTSSQDGASGPL